MFEVMAIKAADSQCSGADALQWIKEKSQVWLVETKKAAN
jgi:hypothetical protein